MRESYEKGLASRSAPTPTLAMVTWRVWHGQGVHAGQVFSSEITTLACPHCPDGGRQHVTRRSWRVVPQRGGVSDPVHVRKLQSREPGDPIGFRFASWHVHDVAERSENVSDGTADMIANRKSDDSIVPAKRANKTRTLAAELVEERGSPKGNTYQKALPRTPSHNGESIRRSVYGKYGEREFIRPSYPREEPYEVVLHVRICAGGRRQRRSLPR